VRRRPLEAILRYLLPHKPCLSLLTYHFPTARDRQIAAYVTVHSLQLIHISHHAGSTNCHSLSLTLQLYHFTVATGQDQNVPHFPFRDSDWSRCLQPICNRPTVSLTTFSIYLGVTQVGLLCTWIQQVPPKRRYQLMILYNVSNRKQIIT